MTQADVVVVGCGPVGVMTALRCAQRGLSVVAIDKSTDVYPLPRAIAMDGEVQDLLVRAGLAEAMKNWSSPMRGGDMADHTGEVVVGIDVPPGTVGALGYPPMVAFDQPSFEGSLRLAARDAGVDFRLGEEVTGVTVHADGSVTVHLGNVATVSSRWVVGADGAKSSVRELVGIEMVDQQFDQTWLVVDTTLLDPSLQLPVRTQQLCEPERIITFVPGHGTRRRWEFQLRGNETREDALDPSFLDHLLSRWATPEQLQVDRTAVYRFHATVAETFRAGPVFLAGDAAHQMPPFNGQGMCSGMRDAENLSWKLAEVHDGRAHDTLLESYDSERRPHATLQVEHSADAGKLMEAIAHNGERALESGYGRRKFPRLDHGLLFGDHVLVGTPLPAPHDGAFTIGDGWTVLRAPSAEPLPDTWHRLGAVVHSISDVTYGTGIGSTETVIVRPDRIVAAVTTDIDTATAQLLPSQL